MRTIFWLWFGALLMAACSAAPTPTPLPTLVPTSTPLPAFDASQFDGLPRGTTEEGYPRLGSADAVAQVVAYGSYDSPANRAAHEAIFPAMVERVSAGDTAYTFVPLYSGGAIGNGQGAARAALCAAEQGQFWVFHALMFQWQGAFGAEAFSATRLQSAADTARLDRDAWEACLISGRPDAIIESAADEASTLDSFAGMPTIYVNGNFVLNDVYSLNVILDQVISRGPIDEAATVEALPTLTPAPTVVTVDLQTLAGEQIPPPIDIDLPPDWEFAYDTYLMRDIDGVRTVPFAIYRGPVEGGTGSIVLMWGFPNITRSNPLEAEFGLTTSTPEPNLWTDGLRLLRLAVLDQTCNIGTDAQRTYSIGDAIGEGTSFAAVDCGDAPDTRGWFVGTQQFQLNFAFFMYTHPIEAMDSARPQIQAVLDTVRFRPLQ